MRADAAPLKVGDWVEVVGSPHFRGPITETDRGHGIALVFYWPRAGYGGWYAEEDLVPITPTAEEEATWLIHQLSQ